MSEQTQLALLLLPYACMVVNVISMTLISHLSRRLAPAIIGGIMLGLLTMLAGVLLCPPIRDGVPSGREWGGQMATALLTYLAYAFCFWTVINLNVTSLRIRILREIGSRPGQSMAESELRAAYDPHAAMVRRIERMVAGKQLVQRTGGQYITGKRSVLQIARFLYILRVIILPPSLRR